MSIFLKVKDSYESTDQHEYKPGLIDLFCQLQEKTSSIINTTYWKETSDSSDPSLTSEELAKNIISSIEADIPFYI